MTNNIETIEVADKMVKLRPSQKQLLEGMKLANKESLADVLDRILEERDLLTKKVNENFNKTSIQKHNEAVKNHLNRIIELNADIEKQAQDIIEMEIQKYYASIEKIQEALLDMANMKEELDKVKVDYDKLLDANQVLDKALEEQQQENQELSKANKQLEKEKHDYITKFNEASLDANKLRDENTKLISEINNKNNDITIFKNDINNLNTTVETKQTEIDSLKLINNTLVDDKKYLQDKLEKSENRIESMMDKHNEMMKVNSDLTNENKELIAANQKLEAKIKELNAKLNKSSSKGKTKK